MSSLTDKKLVIAASLSGICFQLSNAKNIEEAQQIAMASSTVLTALMRLVKNKRLIKEDISVVDHFNTRQTLLSIFHDAEMRLKHPRAPSKIVVERNGEDDDQHSN